MKRLIFIPILFLSLGLFAQMGDANIRGYKGIVFAYLSATAGTTTTVAGTYYYLAGTFTNETMNEFAIVGDTLTYQGSDGLALVALTASFTTDVANAEITVALKKNGVIEVNSEMTVEIGATTDITSLALVDLLNLSTDDNVSIWIKSDQAGAVITAQKVTTSIIIL